MILRPVSHLCVMWVAILLSYIKATKLKRLFRASIQLPLSSGIQINAAIIYPVSAGTNPVKGSWSLRHLSSTVFYCISNISNTELGLLLPAFYVWEDTVVYERMQLGFCQCVIFFLTFHECYHIPPLSSWLLSIKNWLPSNSPWNMYFPALLFLWAYYNLSKILIM